MASKGHLKPADNKYRNVYDPRALAAVLEKAEADLAERRHPDPYIRESVMFVAQGRTSVLHASAPMFPGGTKWCVDVLDTNWCSD